MLEGLQPLISDRAAPVRAAAVYALGRFFGHPERTERVVHVESSMAMALVAAGNALQLAAKLALRRSVGIAPAHRGLKTGGPYGLVRHPMYAGYLLVHIGILILMPSVLNAGVYAIGWLAQLRRLAAEEALLGGDPAYRAYCQKVRWRLVPRVF